MTPNCNVCDEDGQRGTRKEEVQREEKTGEGGG